MRIVSGYLKGRRLFPPKNFKARPTTDTAKEALFNILYHSIEFEELNVLDLFAGTGAISYEFASRGVKSVTAIEKDFFHFKFIKDCVSELLLENIVYPIKADVFYYLANTQNQQFDLIFADPPFDFIKFDEVVPAVLNSSLLKPQGLFILEHGPTRNFSEHPEFRQIRKYGKVHFSFFEKNKH